MRLKSRAGGVRGVAKSSAPCASASSQAFALALTTMSGTVRVSKLCLKA
jgi:hypothetical protein